MTTCPSIASYCKERNLPPLVAHKMCGVRSKHSCSNHSCSNHCMGSEAFITVQTVVKAENVGVNLHPSACEFFFQNVNVCVCACACVCACGCVCVCVWLACGSNRQEEQVAPRWVLPGWWLRIGGRCPFTIHVPSASAGGDCVPVTKRQQRDGGKHGTAILEKPTDRVFSFSTILHFSLTTEAALTDLAPAPEVDYTTLTLVWYSDSSA